MQHTPHRDRICEQSRHLPHRPVLIHGMELTTVKKCIPVRKIDLCLVDLYPRVLELGKEPPAHKIMVVLVDLPQQITYLQMRAVVVHKMLFAARYGNPAVGTLVRNVTGRLLRSSCFHCLSAFRIKG